MGYSGRASRVKIRSLGALIVAIVLVLSLFSISPAEADDIWKVEGAGNSAGISHKQETLVFPDPVPEAAPAPVVQGGEASGDAAGGVGGGKSAFLEELERCQALESEFAPQACIGALVGTWFGAGQGGSASAGSGVVEAGGAGVPVVVTSSDVSKVMANGSGITRQPPGAKALVSKIVIVYTSGDSQTLETEVGGAPVTIVATPVSYAWDWGDGATTTTTDPGAAYPDQTVFHKYSHTAKGVVISLTTTWSATYSVEGGPAQPISGTLTTTDTANPFDLVRRISYLTDDAEEAQGH